MSSGEVNIASMAPSYTLDDLFKIRRSVKTTAELVRRINSEAGIKGECSFISL